MIKKTKKLILAISKLLKGLDLSQANDEALNKVANDIIDIIKANEKGLTADKPKASKQVYIKFTLKNMTSQKEVMLKNVLNILAYNMKLSSPTFKGLTDLEKTKVKAEIKKIDKINVTMIKTLGLDKLSVHGSSVVILKKEVFDEYFSNGGIK